MLCFHVDKTIHWTSYSYWQTATRESALTVSTGYSISSQCKHQNSPANNIDTLILEFVNNCQSQNLIFVTVYQTGNLYTDMRESDNGCFIYTKQE